MNDDSEDLETIAVGPTWPSGWYSDPWTAGQYRFWNGGAWTGETHRAGPGGAPGDPSAWSPAPSPSARPPRNSRVAAVVAGLVVLVLLAGAIGYAIEASTEAESSAAKEAPEPSETLPGSGVAPAVTRALSALVVQQADVGPTRVVLLIPDGNRTTQPTLDLCNGRFATEKLRIARLQVAEVDSSGNGLLSTEAVGYRSAAASTSAFAELRRVRAACPRTPVVSPVHEPTATTTFRAPPDRTWAQTPSVERLAYSFDTTASGTKSPSVAVYLRRGRLLLGVYFPRPNGRQPAVAGRTSIEGIVGVFAARMAELPASAVNASG